MGGGEEKSGGACKGVDWGRIQKQGERVSIKFNRRIIELEGEEGSKDGILEILRCDG